MVTSTDQPTDRPTNRQGEYRAICLFRKLENRKEAEICNLSCWYVLLKYCCCGQFLCNFFLLEYFLWIKVQGIFFPRISFETFANCCSGFMFTNYRNLSFIPDHYSFENFASSCSGQLLFCTLLFLTKQNSPNCDPHLWSVPHCPKTFFAPFPTLYLNSTEIL